jgi:hypothetical protein
MRGLVGWGAIGGGWLVGLWVGGGGGGEGLGGLMGCWADRADRADRADGPDRLMGLPGRRSCQDSLAVVILRCRINQSG